MQNHKRRRNLKMKDLTKWAPKSTQRLFDDLFGDTFQPLSFSLFGNDPHPNIELKEDDTNIVLRAELPGMTKDDIEVELKDSILTLSGEKKSEKNEEGEKYYRTEISYGKFTRSFHIPVDIKEQEINASFKDGILIVKMPKSEENQTRKIEVK
jgi:HSP20 family protein